MYHNWEADVAESTRLLLHIILYYLLIHAYGIFLVTSHVQLGLRLACSVTAGGSRVAHCRLSSEIGHDKAARCYGECSFQRDCCLRVSLHLPVLSDTHLRVAFLLQHCTQDSGQHIQPGLYYRVPGPSSKEGNIRCSLLRFSFSIFVTTFMKQHWG